MGDDESSSIHDGYGDELDRVRDMEDDDMEEAHMHMDPGENSDSSDEENNDPIQEEDAWTVISSHFRERGLVGQQLDSYDVFMTNQMQVRLRIPPQNGCSYLVLSFGGLWF